MPNSLLSFENIPWETADVGMIQKVHFVGNQKMRLVIFSDEFKEAGWCSKGHTGFILEGQMKVQFTTSILSFKKGDGIHIEEGTPHKLIVEKLKKVELLLFEK